MKKLDRKAQSRAFLLSLTTLLLWGGFILLKTCVKGAYHGSQIIAVVATVVSYFAWRALYRVFFKKPLARVTSRVKAALGRVWRRVKARASSLAEKIRKALGMTDYSRVRGKDERSFIFGRREERRKKRSKDKLHWNELLTNRERLRYVYVHFVKQSEKRGYRYHSYETPIENGHAWASPEGTPERTIFDAYTDARFAGEGERLTDREFETYAELVGKKKKKDKKA